MDNREGYNPLIESKPAIDDINQSNKDSKFNFRKKYQTQYYEDNIENNKNFNQNTKNQLINSQNLIDEDNYNDLISGNRTNYIPSNRQKISINWKNVKNIDLDLIANTNDLTLLNENLENLIYSSVTNDDIQSVSEENVVKLIQILQYINKSLFFRKQEITDDIINLRKNKKIIINENKQLDENLISQKEYLDKAKLERNIRMKNIADYKNAVDNLIRRGGGRPMNGMKVYDLNVDIKKNTNLMRGRYNEPLSGYKCKFCIGKTFTSVFELKKHLNDIHLIESPIEEEYKNNINQVEPIPSPQQINITLPPMQNNNNDNNINHLKFLNMKNANEEIQNKINEMKFELQEYKHKNEIDKMQQKLLKRKNDKIEGDNNLKQYLENMENNFSQKCQQMIDVISHNSNKNEQQKIIIQSKPIPPQPKNIPNNDKEIEALKKEINDIRNSLYNKQNEHKLKISSLKEQITLLTKKRDEKVEEEVNVEINQEPQEINEKKEIILVPEQNRTIQITKTNVRKVAKSHHFHSGIIESDHDDSDIEREKKKKIIKYWKNEAEIYNTVLRSKKKKIEIGGKIKNDSQNEILRSVNLDKLSIIDKEDLDHFYKEYINRDNKFLSEPKFKKYFKAVLPNKFINDNGVKQNAFLKFDNRMIITASKFANEDKSKYSPNIEIDDLVKEDKIDLIDMAKDIFEKMELINEKNGKKDPYYLSAEKLVKFDQIKKTIEDFEKVEEIDKKEVQEILKSKNEEYEEEYEGGEEEEEEK